MGLPVLRSARLSLRPYTEQDVDALHELWTDPDVRRYLWDDEVISRERAEMTVHDAIATAEREGFGQWLLLGATTSSLAGFCGLMRREPDADPELLYGLAREFWGRGLATEAAIAVLAYAFDELGCVRITAATDTANRSSARVLERIGMRFMHRGTLNGLDTLFYELLRAQFRASLAGCGPHL
jgi:ribosomal-protein-alanine N-acetyltransferase